LFLFQLTGIMTNDEICWNKAAVIAVMVFFSLGIIALSTGCAIMYWKLRRNQCCQGKLDEPKRAMSQSIRKTVSAAQLVKK